MPSAVLRPQDGEDESIPTHPLGVKPLGNRFLADGPDAKASAGTWALLPDEVLMVVLEQLDETALVTLGACCKFLYAFTRADELWKALFIRLDGLKAKHLQWLGSWRSTYLSIPANIESKVNCGSVYSDVLHRPFACSNIRLSTYAQGIPKANQIRRFNTMPYDEYASNWTETPFILTNCIQDWPVFSKWSIKSILNEYFDVEFRAEAVDWTFSRYFNYMSNTQDESPLYLFDRKFAEKMDLVVGKEDGAAYWKPECFGPDMFELLSAERPAHRWLIIGPERSGSTFHKDPNGTSAWNAVIQGSKYWIMFPPSAQVPGVYVSQDSSEVTSPLSIAEWLLTFHAEARAMPECTEGICEAGEILHVPSGWWHLVVNLENGIALTQNFVPKSPNLKLLSEALAFLRDRADQVSGFDRNVEDPYKLFAERLQQHDPEMFARAIEIADKSAGKKRKWDALLAPDDTESVGGGGFSFGFGGDDVDEDGIP